jgi:hypothetical protein
MAWGVGSIAVDNCIGNELGRVCYRKAKSRLIGNSSVYCFDQSHTVKNCRTS